MSCLCDPAAGNEMACDRLRGGMSESEMIIRNIHTRPTYTLFSLAWRVLGPLLQVCRHVHGKIFAPDQSAFDIVWDGDASRIRSVHIVIARWMYCVGIQQGDPSHSLRHAALRRRRNIN